MARNDTIRFRVDDEERARIEELATFEGLDVSAYVRRLALAGPSERERELAAEVERLTERLEAVRAATR